MAGVVEEEGVAGSGPARQPLEGINDVRLIFPPKTIEGESR